jgi:hypothetical protein
MQVQKKHPVFTKQLLRSITKNIKECDKNYMDKIWTEQEEALERYRVMSSFAAMERQDSS